MDLFTIFPAWLWLVFSGIFFALGEYLSKRFALAPGALFFVLLIIAYTIDEILWLPALFEKNSLAITGTLWSVISLVITVTIGLFIFREKLSTIHWVGIGFAVVAIVLLSI